MLIKQLMPDKVIAVERKILLLALRAALDAGHPVDLPRVGVIVCRGVAVKRIGDETFRSMPGNLDDIIPPSIAMLSARR